jgi:hypothetical protein
MEKKSKGNNQDAIEQRLHIIEHKSPLGMDFG